MKHVRLMVRVLRKAGPCLRAPYELKIDVERNRYAQTDVTSWYKNKAMNFEDHSSLRYAGFGVPKANDIAQLALPCVHVYQ